MSVFEKFGLLPARLLTVANLFTALLTGIFRGGKRPPTYRRYVAYTAVRTLMRVTSLKQQHYMQATTDEAYQVFCKKHNFKPESETLADGTMAHWIGPKTASKVIVNFHGGGFVLTAGPEMYEFMWQIQDFISKQGKDVAVIFLSYGKSPAHGIAISVTDKCLQIWLPKRNILANSPKPRLSSPTSLITYPRNPPT